MFGIRYRYAFIILLAVYSYLNITYTVGERLFNFPVPSYLLFLTVGVVVAGVWELNLLAEKTISKNLRGKKIHPLIVLFLASLLNVVIVCVICVLLVDSLLNLTFTTDSSHIRLLLTFGFRINLFLNCVNAIFFFMGRLKQTQLEAERFKKNLIEAQFEALRNQINPHFLFNCFNVLSTLVYKDADTASKFIAQLSNVYRYLLYNQEKRIVVLKDELAFIDSYLFLLKIRFGDNIQIENRIRPEDQQSCVPPAVLQMLVENAIKHNIISKRNPLAITFQSESGYLSVSNNLQEKAVKEDSLQIGLKNIINRYEFLSERHVEITKNQHFFIVRIPLLQIEGL